MTLVVGMGWAPASALGASPGWGVWGWLGGYCSESLREGWGWTGQEGLAQQHQPPFRGPVQGGGLDVAWLPTCTAVGTAAYYGG